MLKSLLSLALTGAPVATSQAIDVYIGSAYDSKLQQLAGNRNDWDYVADRAGLWLHPNNKKFTSQEALVQTIAGMLSNKSGVIERNALPVLTATVDDVKDRIDWAKTTVGLNQVFFYFNGGGNFADPQWASRAAHARSKGAAGSWMGLAPHEILDQGGWSDPYFNTTRAQVSQWDAFSYDGPQDEFEFDADVRKAFYGATGTADQAGKYNVPLLSTHRTTDDAFFGGQYEVRDLRNRPNTNVTGWGIEDYTNGSTIPFTPETLPDGSVAKTVTGLARWIYLYYDGALTAVARQGESNTSRSGVVNSSAYPGYSGTGYADFGGAGTWAQWSQVLNETNESSTTARLVFRYAAGAGARPCSVTVNGGNALSISLPATASWSTWDTVAINVTLNKGNNVIRLTAGANGGPNLDKMDVIFPPLAPTGVVVDEQTNKNVVTWTQSLGANTYRVQRATSKAGPFTQIATGLTGTSYNDTSVNSGTVYFYSVTAHKNGGLDSEGSEVTEAGLISRFKPVAVKKDNSDPPVDLVQPGHPGEDGNDDDDTTYWAALEYTYPQPWRINLKTPKNLDRIAIKWYGVGTNRQYKYRVDVSNDNINFTTAVPEKWNGAADTIDSLNTIGRHVRVMITDTNTTNARAALYEARVYGD